MSCTRETTNTAKKCCPGDKKSIDQRQSFTAWQVLLSTCSRSVQIPPVSSFDKRVIIDKLTDLLVSTIRKLLSSDETVVKYFKDRIDASDLDRFIKYFNAPTEDEPTMELLSVIIGSDKVNTIPLVLLEFVFDVLKSSFVLKDWALIKYDFSSERLCQHILIAFRDDEKVKYSDDIKKVCSPTIPHDVLVEALKVDLVTSNIKHKTLAFITARHNEPINLLRIPVNKSIVDTKVMFDIGMPNTTHVSIQKLYPFVEDRTVVDHIIKPYDADLEVEKGNDRYLLENGNDIKPIYLIGMGDSLSGGAFVQNLSMLTSVSDEKDIEIIRDDPEKIVILINKA